MKHISGRPISVSTYRHHGCRCSDCTALATAKVREDRAKRGHALTRVESKTRNLAAEWVRVAHPEQWEAFRMRAYDHFGIERRPRGRPTSHG